MNQHSPGNFAQPPHPSWQRAEPYPAELVEKRRFGCLSGLTIILLLVGILVVSVGYLAAPGEVMRWRIAAADEKRLDGDLAGAIAELDRLAGKNPNNIELLSRRARWHVEAENYEQALEDYNRLIELRPSDISHYLARSQVYQHLGRHVDAIADWKHIMESDAAQLKRGRAFFLNGFAYARALADVEIEEALADVDEAMRRDAQRYEMLDTRGFLYYRQGDFERALDDLNQSVQSATEDYERALGSEKGFGLPDRREQELQLRSQAKMLAVILYHRGLAYEGNGDKESAERDFERVRELGFEPNEKLF